MMLELMNVPMKIRGFFYKLAVQCKYILGRYASTLKGRSLILDSGGPASTS